MNALTIAIIVAIVAGLIAVLAARSGGPRVTQITREVHSDEDATDA